MHNLRRLACLCVIVLALASLQGQSGQPGKTIRLTEGTNIAAALSPDGRTLAIDLLGSLWILPAAGGTARRITDDFLDARQPVWSPDGRRLAFQAYLDATWDLWTIAPDGSDLKRLTWGPYDDREPDWSPDGIRVAFASDRGGNYGIWEVAVRSGELRQITTHPGNEYMPAWSPDGREIAFVSDRPDAPGVWAIRDGAERLVAGAVGSVNGPSWAPDGKQVLFNLIAASRSRLVLDGRELTSGEDVFPFRAKWISKDEILYTADGKVKRRVIGDRNAVRTIEFSAEVTLARPAAAPRPRSFPGPASQHVRGIMHPAVSPDGRSVAFVALGDLWVMSIGSPPQRITNDPFVEAWPAWAPDGAHVAFSSDRAGTMDVWLRDMRTGTERRLTELADSAIAAAWSPDSSRIAFVDEDEVFVADVRSRQVTRVRDGLLNPGRPSWSPDGRFLVVAAVQRYSTRFREGRNRILRIALDGRADRWFEPIPHRSVGSRQDYGPVWSPDGTQMAVVIDGVLWTFFVNRDGEPIGPPRRLSTELANAPSWTGDSGQILYQATDGLRLVRLDGGRVQEVAVDLKWSPRVARGRVVVHAGGLVDGRTPTLRSNVDIVIEGNRIRHVETHRPELHAGTVVDASGETVIPGLIGMHEHFRKWFGEVVPRAYLAYGVTTIRNPSAHPFETLEDREAIEAGVRPGPRVFTSGAAFDGTRAYYAGMLSLDGGAQLELELERARSLGFDVLKTYVRLPDPLQKRVIEFAARHGIPVTSHELYPAVAYGAAGVEHIRGTSRRGYSPKVSALNRSYRDVIDLLVASRVAWTPTLGIHGAFRLLTLRDPSWLDDPRAALLPARVTAELREYVVRERGANLAERAAVLRPYGQTVFNVVSAGGRVVAGTDSPLVPYGLSVQTELEHFVEAGLTPLQALQAATIVSAEAMGVGAQLGSIEPGKLADLVIVEGNPLADIRHARRVRRVMADGQLFDADALLKRPARHTEPTPSR